MTDDMAPTIAPKSDQLGFEDVRPPIKHTITIIEARVLKGSEQPVELHTREFPGRPYKPGKSMRRVLVAAWGADSSVYAGRSLEIYGDPDILFGGQKVGGVRISAMSHIDKPLAVSLTVTRGKRAQFTVQSLKDAPAPTPTPADQIQKALNAIRNAPDASKLAGIWAHVEKLGLADKTELIDASNQRTEELRGDA